MYFVFGVVWAHSCDFSAFEFVQNRSNNGMFSGGLFFLLICLPVQLCQCLSTPLSCLGDQPGLTAFLAHESGQVTQKIFLFHIAIYLHFQLTIFKTNRAQMLAQACGQNFLSGLI